MAASTRSAHDLMHPVLEDLVHLLELERIETNIFRGASRDIGSPQVFGGQVLGQALSAAQHTVEGRVAHSLHAYFLRRGDINAPIIYEVERARDGGSFSARRVVAIQHGRPILNLAASFQAPEDGIDHQVEMPDVPPPDGLRDFKHLAADMLDKMPVKLGRFMTDQRPFDFRPVEPDNLFSAKELPPVKNIWIRAVDALADELALHQNILAYVSDFELLATATLPHAISLTQGNILMASIDHALWFHRPFRVDDWLLYSMESPTATGVRGFSRGHFFKADGRLVASVSQEGLVRIVDAAHGQRSDPRTQV